PLALIEQYSDRVQPWIWQCHLDMSNPHPSLWDYLSRFVGEYDAANFSLPEYRQPLGIDQRFITPAINPFSDKNLELTDQQIIQSLAFLMRIGQIAPLAEMVRPKLYGGTERVIAWLVDELIDLGHEVTLFASGDSKTRAELIPAWPRALRLGRPRADPIVAQS